MLVYKSQTLVLFRYFKLIIVSTYAKFKLHIRKQIKVQMFSKHLGCFCPFKPSNKSAPDNNQATWFINVYQLVTWQFMTVLTLFIDDLHCMLKEVRHIEMPKAAPKKSICHFQKLDMILKWNKQNTSTVRLPQKYHFY